MDALPDAGRAPDEPSGHETFGAAVRLLARREHSRVELRRKLRTRGHPPEAVEQALARLGEYGYQSDARFAESFVRSRVDRGQGRLKIVAALRERGIDDGIASALLDLGEPEWRRLATAALHKRFGDAAPADRAEWAKRARFLAGRGFTSDIVSRVLDGGGTAAG